MVDFIFTSTVFSLIKNQGENVQWTCGFCDRSCVLLSVFLSIYAIKSDIFCYFNSIYAVPLTSLN